MPRRLLALSSILLVVSPLCAVARAHAAGTAATAKSPAEPTAWTSYANDNQLRNSASSSFLTRQSVRRLTSTWTTTLDGAVYASPLAFRVAGRQLLFVATEAGSVYALDASTGEAVWKRDLGTVTTAECGTWGITSTGVIDPMRGLLFVIGATGSLHALDISTGEESAGYPEQVVDQTAFEYVWGGLRIAGGRVYVVIASYCDVGGSDVFPEGSLKSLPLDRASGAIVWDPVPGPQNLGGIWGWGGVSVDPRDGSIFTAVGNSHVHSETCDCFVDDAGYGDSIVRLTADLSSVIDADNPGIAGTDDYDFGAAPVLFQPEGCPPLAAANNKNGTLYVWNRTSLAAGPVAEIPISDGRAAFVGTPAWSAATQTIYEAQAALFGAAGALGNGVRAFRVTTGCRFTEVWAAALGDGNQAMPLVVGDGQAWWVLCARRAQRGAPVVGADCRPDGRSHDHRRRFDLRRRHEGNRLRVPPGPAPPIAALAGVSSTLVEMETISFARGNPAHECIPVEELADCARAAVERDGSTVLSYGPVGGYQPLREWIGERHGVDPGRVLITNGSLQGMVFLAERFRSGRVLVEAPTYDRPLKILAGHGVEVSPVAMDDEGLDPSALEQALGSGEKPAFLYTIPTFQNPSGRTLSTERRHRLVELAREHGLPVLEDDPYGLVRYEGTAPPTLFELEGGELVTYSSSFSKTIAPGLRVGYFVLPPALERELEALAVSTYITPVLLGQATVYEFLRRGNFEPNLERVRSLLGARRDAMLEALEAEFPGARWSHPEGGYFIWLELPEGTDTTALLEPAGEAGVTYVPGPDFGGPANTARLAFSFVSVDEIREGVRRLAALVPVSV